MTSSPVSRRSVLGASVSVCVGLSAGLLALAPSARAAEELRVLTHSSFGVPKALLAQFEKENNAKLSINKAGDAGEMLNKLILTKASPIADVVYGIDNALAPKALAADVLAATNTAAASRKANASLPAPLVSVDYGYVTLNYDKAWFAKHGVPLPKTLDDLTQPAYAKLLVVQNPATSSPGYAFLLSTIGALGEDKAFDFWAKLRSNGVKVVKGWSEAYYTDFSKSGGKYPLVVSYASSPAAELFYSKTKLSEPPTGSLVLPGAVFRQVEGVALVKGGKNVALAEKFIEFLRSTPVQQQMQTEMWMQPAEASVPVADALRVGEEPSRFDAPSDADIAAKGAAWVKRWTQVVLK
ncbi:thiamine ABC transporter substrate-binding protein [Curvibacter sp. CHRR-16]|uniref:thiamine ABC transporter substrate-binding protein n=1 Tax=Curvibacter sp. CHRR-16 TaxID=2835872 RepID=UPI001BDA6008|nr:thiamine ABC transporter substrate-binding protein [Curvibacter sp. CHRR-16]MBT0569053.1 thiamine ABC transporter substrate-binding protein [Curvibacter sp. CHRR-16]